MPDMIRVKPKVPGTIVRNPQRNFRRLKAEGELVPNSGYWIRRLLSGCVVEVKDEVPAQGEAPPPTAVVGPAQQAGREMTSLALRAPDEA